MKMKIAAAFLTSVALAGVAFAGPAEKGLEITKKADKANEGFKSESSEMQMVLIYMY